MNYSKLLLAWRLLISGGIYCGKNPSATVMNAITVDVEDWFHVCGLDREPLVHPSRRRALRNTEKILSLLAEFGVKGTFFVLGSVAESEPGLVPMIAAEGHEIASHGYSHKMVTELDPWSFREELRRTAHIIGAQAGMQPLGFRAPQWSIRDSVPWAFDVLWEEGYRYDSSLNPLPFVGNARGSRIPHLRLTKNGSIVEIPPMVTPTPFGNLPTGGGWGFRFFPAEMISGSVRQMNDKGFPAVFYLHPRELDPDGPRLWLGLLKGFAAYGPKVDARVKMRLLLERFRFGTLRDMVEKWQFA